MSGGDSTTSRRLAHHCSAYRHAAASHARLSRSRRVPPAGQAHPTSLTRPSTSVCPPRPRRSAARAQPMRRAAAPSNRVRHSVPRPAPADEAPPSSGGPAEPAGCAARAQIWPGELPAAPAPQTAELGAPVAPGDWPPVAATATGVAGASAQPPPRAPCAAPLPGAFNMEPRLLLIRWRSDRPRRLPCRPRRRAPVSCLVIFAPLCHGKRTLKLFSPGASTPSNRCLASRVASPSPHHPPHDSHDPRLCPTPPPSSRQAVSRCLSSHGP